MVPGKHCFEKRRTRAHHADDKDGTRRVPPGAQSAKSPACHESAQFGHTQIGILRVPHPAAQAVGFNGIAKSALRLAEIVEDLRKAVGKELTTTVGNRHCRIEIDHADDNVINVRKAATGRERPEGVGISRVEPHRRLVGSSGLVQSTDGGENEAMIVVNRRVVGGNCKRLANRLKGVVKCPSLSPERHCPPHQSRHVIGLNVQHGIE